MSPGWRIASLLTLAWAACLTGCAGGDTPAGRHEMVKADPTPELFTLYQRPVDADNRIVLTMDENWRMFNQDMGRLWLLDRPSRLTRERVPR